MTATSPLTAPKVCIVAGCDEPHLARQFCGRHYQVWRRSGEPPLAEVKAERDREWRVRRVLELGCLGEGQVRPDEAELRRGWEELGPEITAEFEAHGNGHRPWAWWRYVAERDQYVGRSPEEPGPHGLVKRIRWSHEAKVESLSWMARNGHLTDAERERIAQRGREARERIKAGRERKASLGEGYGADREDVAVADAVEAA